VAFLWSFRGNRAGPASPDSTQRGYTDPASIGEKLGYHRILWLSAALCGACCAQNLNCNLQGYKGTSGVKVQPQNGSLIVTWGGERGQELRAAFAVQQDQPVIRELAVKKKGGPWVVLGKDLSPEYQVTTGKRRMSEQQMAPLRKLNVAMTPEFLKKERWNAFWDAPLNLPGNPGTSEDLPRTADEIKRSSAKFRPASRFGRCPGGDYDRRR
jgi:hypothetical protein